MFCAYTSGKGRTLIDRELYLPKSIADRDRCRDAGVPEDVEFATKQEVCELHVEDFDLHLDDEHVRLHGKGSSARTVLLDDRDLVQWPEPGGQRPGIREA